MKKYRALLIPAAAFGLTLAALLILFLHKGLYPFGGDTLPYGDAYSQIIPYFHQVTDGGGLFVSLQTGMAGGTWGDIAYYALSPLNILLFFFQNKLHAFQIILLLKFACCSASMALLLCKRTRRLDPLWVLILSLCYGFCAYNLTMSTIISWLDAVILFPLLLLALDRLIRSGKTLPYIAVLAAMIIFSFYLSVMVLFFLLIVSPLYAFFALRRESRGQVSLRFGLSTLAGIGLSLPVSLPTVLQIGQSARNNTELWDSLTKGFDTGNTAFKVSILFTCAVAFAVFWRFGRDYWRRRASRWLPVTAALFLVPIIAESVNLAWHMGSVNGLPYRYGFIPTALLLLLAADTLQVKKSSFTAKKTLPRLAVSCLCAWILLSAWRYDRYNIMLSLGLAVLFLLAFRFCVGSPHRSALIALPVVAVQLLMMSNNYINNASSGPFTENYAATQALGEMTGSGGTYERLLDKDLRLSSNAALVHGSGSLARYSSLISARYYTAMSQLGYSVGAMTVLDAGGTLFSDTALGGAYMLYDHASEDSFMTFAGQPADGLYLYRNDKPMMGVLFSGEQSDMPADDSIGNQNGLFAALSGSRTPLISSHGFEPTEAGARAALRVSGPSRLYLQMPEGSLLDVKVFVNGAPLRTRVDGFMHTPADNRRYENAFPLPSRNGLLYLGAFQDETVEITLERLTQRDLQAAKIGVFDMSAFAEFVNSARTPAEVTANGGQLSVTFDARSGDRLFLPVAYDPSWTCLIDGAQTEIKPFFGAFMSIDVPAGYHTMTLSYLPPGMGFALIAAALTLLILLLVRLVSVIAPDAVKRIKMPKIAGKIAWIMLLTASAAVFIYLYVIPILWYLFDVRSPLISMFYR